MRKTCIQPASRAATFLTTAVLVSALAVPAGADPRISRPFDAGYDCTNGLDSLGSVVAAGGDFDGDGVADFAYAAPCSPVGVRLGVGRVWIRSGKTGALLRRARGRAERMYFGAALAFVGDLNGDGKDELAVGAPGYDAPPDGLRPELRGAGQVRVLTAKSSGPYLKLFGQYANAEYGASVAAIADLNSDGVEDLLVGAPGEQKSASDTTKTGVVHVLSGRGGKPLHHLAGAKAAQRFGTTLRDVGRYDGDNTNDILITSEKNPVGGVENAGGLEVRSGAQPETVVFRFGGAINDRLGASSASDGIDGTFIVGVPGRRLDGGARRVGAAMAFAGSKGLQFVASSATPQENAQLGTAVAMLGDIDGDRKVDFAVSEPFLDLPVEAGKTEIIENAGRITFLSGVGGSEISRIEGVYPETRLGRSLTGGFDFDRDGVPDLLSGNPGDSPIGRRGAGTAIVFSGRDGSVLRLFRGTRGVETRIFAAGGHGKKVTLRGFRADGRQAGVNTVVFEGDAVATAEPSVDVLDRTIYPPAPGGQRVVVGAGHGATSSEVAVVSGAKKKQILQRFAGFPGEEVGANVAAGDLDNDGQDDIVVAEASSGSGRVRVRIFEQLTNNPYVTGWVMTGEFEAFSAGAAFGVVPIDADGANLVVTGLRPEGGREIIVAPMFGAPIVRVFSNAGTKLLEWPAYELDGTVSGLSIAAIDLDGNGNKEIVTVPMNGPSIVRVFNDDGLPFAMPGAATPVSFQAFADPYVGGARVASGDVDLDGRQEILVVKRKPGQDEIVAYEADGTQVQGFATIDAFDESGTISISATDRFLRK